jgi:hypothetical protein
MDGVKHESETLMQNGENMENSTQLSFNLENPYQPDRSALNGLFQKSSRYRASYAFWELMQFVARFSQYSPYNCMLLHIQNPEVTHVATPSQWWKRFHRTVKRNARPLLILAPRCPILFVYDMADTEGKPLPEHWREPFGTKGQITTNTWNRSVENCKQDQIMVRTTTQFSFLHAGTAFRLRSGNRNLPERPEEAFDFLVEVQEDPNLATQYATLTHELGHIYSGHLGKRPGDWWVDRKALSKKVVEIEAESIAYLVCQRRGIETKSAEYLAHFADERIELPPVDIERVLSVTYHIERMGEELLTKKVQ